MIAVVFAAAAAMLMGTGVARQHEVASAEESSAVVDPRLVLRLLRKRRWLQGIGIAMGGFVLQAIAIGSGRLVFVEPVLACQILVALLLAARTNGSALGRHEHLGIIATVGGLGGFLALATPTSATDAGDPAVSWAVPLAALAVVVPIGALVAGRRTPTARTVVLATMAGLTFGFSDALLKVMSDVADAGGAADIGRHWGLYAWMAVSPIAFVLQQSAYQAGHLGAALPAAAGIQPAVAIGLGALVLGEPLRSGWVLPAELALLGVLLVGITSLARAPALVDSA